MSEATWLSLTGSKAIGHTLIAMAPGPQRFHLFQVSRGVRHAGDLYIRAWNFDCADQDAYMAAWRATMGPN